MSTRRITPAAAPEMGSREAESPAKYGPVSVGDRTKTGAFPLQAPANIGGDATFALVQYRPHAEYIARAINCHDDLLAALKAMMEGSIYSSLMGLPADWHTIRIPNKEALELARAALAKVEAA